MRLGAGSSVVKRSSACWPLSFLSLFLRPCLIHARMPGRIWSFLHGHTFLHSWSGPITLVVGLLHGAICVPVQSYTCSLRVFYMTLVVWKGHLSNPTMIILINSWEGNTPTPQMRNRKGIHESNLSGQIGCKATLRREGIGLSTSKPGYWALDWNSGQSLLPAANSLDKFLVEYSFE